MSAAGGVAAYRAVEPIPAFQDAAGGADMPRPEYRDVRPTDLLVDDSYQRGLSDKGRALIQRIVASWDWCSFKPPSVVEVNGQLHVIDGQHTAIAAATHPAIDTIPVQVVEALAQEDRALAFVRVNRDRVAVTKPELFHALVEAGDEDATTIKQVCDRAGVQILKHKPGREWRVGETLAYPSVAGMVDRRHALGARRVLEILVKAELAPVTAVYMRAVEAMLFDEDTRGRFEPDDLSTLIRERGERILDEAEVFAFGQRVPKWRALASMLFRNVKKKRGV